VYQRCEFKFRRGKNKNLTALKYNSNTVWFNFQTYIYIYKCLLNIKLHVFDIKYRCTWWGSLSGSGHCVFGMFPHTIVTIWKSTKMRFSIGHFGNFEGHFGNSGAFR
jgi:hypothetical protein